MAKSYLNNSSLPRGLRNNNPGNIVQTNQAWVGKVPLSQNPDGRFEQYTELRYGIRAMMRVLISYAKAGYSTISLMINRYAPAFENNTRAYIDAVSQKTGIKPDQQITKLTKSLLIELGKAIVIIENGPIVNQYINDQDFQDGYNILDLDINSIALPAKKKVK